MQPSNKASILACACFGSIHMIVGAGILALLRADEGQVFDAGHIGRMRARQHASRKGLLD